jgi:hypothetical protein
MGHHATRVWLCKRIDAVFAQYSLHHTYLPFDADVQLVCQEADLFPFRRARPGDWTGWAGVSLACRSSSGGNGTSCSFNSPALLLNLDATPERDVLRNVLSG